MLNRGSALKDQNYKELLKEEEDKMAKDKAGVGDKEGEDKVGSAPKQQISSDSNHNNEHDSINEKAAERWLLNMIMTISNLNTKIQRIQLINITRNRPLP
jgi:hypothetical protein